MDKVQKAYKGVSSFYDDAMVSQKWWSRLFRRSIWGCGRQEVLIDELFDSLPDDARVRVLDVPAGTLVFSAAKYRLMSNAEIVGLDYSEDMIALARSRVRDCGLKNVVLEQGDVGNMRFQDGCFDYVVCLNGLHVFPDKEAAFAEIARVLRPGGVLIASNYLRGVRRLSDVAARVYALKGLITPPFDDEKQLRARLAEHFSVRKLVIKGSLMALEAVRL